jgi:hypothetical protein
MRGSMSDLAVQSGAAAGFAEERIFDARLPYEGTQEVRAEGRAETLPVYEAVEIGPRRGRGCNELRRVCASEPFEITAGKESAIGCSVA